MKTYYINQKLISLNDKYYVYDTNDKLCLEVVSNGLLGFLDRILGRLFSLGHKLHIKNLDGSEFATIKKRTSFFWGKYDIFCGERNIALIKEQRTAFKFKILITTEKSQYLITGDIFASDFIISKNSITVARVKKAIFNFKDKYAIDIFEEENDKIFISAAIAIDNIFHN